MKYHSMSQYSSLSDVALFGARQSSWWRSAPYLPGGVELWRAFCKVLLLAVPVLLAVSLVLGAVGERLDRSLAESESRHQQLIDNNINLLAQRARIYAPDRVSRLAADKLSLYAATPGQIERIN